MPIPLRSDYDAAQLRRIARDNAEADQVRRPLALAAIYAGASPHRGGGNRRRDPAGDP